MANKQAQNLFEALAMIKNLMGSAQTERTAAENQQYNKLLKDEGLRGVYGGRNVEIGNFATPDSKESRTAMEADILDQEGKPRTSADGTQEQDMLDLNALLAKTKYSSKYSNDKPIRGMDPKYYDKEYEGMTDEQIAEKKIADALELKASLDSEYNALSDTGLGADAIINSKEFPQIQGAPDEKGNMPRSDMRVLNKISKEKIQELFKKDHPEFEQADRDIAFYSALKKAPKTTVKYGTIEKALEPSEALLEGDLQKYMKSTGEKPKSYEAMEAMDKGVVNREQLQTLRPRISTQRYKELESNIDASERKKTGSSSNPNYKRIAGDLDKIDNLGTTLNVEIDDEATSTSELDRFVARYLRDINNPDNDLADYEKQMLKRKILDVLNGDKVYFTKMRGRPVRSKTESMNKTSKSLGL